MNAASFSREMPFRALTVLRESVMMVPLAIRGNMPVFKVAIWSRRSSSALISAALFSLISGRGNDEVMVVFPMRRITEQPDDSSSFVEPSVKARKWVSDGLSGMKGGGGKNGLRLGGLSGFEVGEDVVKAGC